MRDIILQIAADKGVSPFAVKKWRQRKKVPSKYWFQFQEEAKKRGVDLEPSDFGYSTPKRKKAA